MSLNNIIKIASTVLVPRWTRIELELSLRIFGDLADFDQSHTKLISSMATLIRGSKTASLGGISACDVSRVRNTTDPRDHVYGVLGILDAGFVSILKKNMGPSVYDFAKQLASFDVRHAYGFGTFILLLFEATRGTMTSFAFATGAAGARASPYKLCSWSLDWSRKGQNITVLDGMSNFDACKGTKASFPGCDESGYTHLPISSYAIGIVDQVASSISLTAQRQGSDERKVIETLKLWWDFVNASSPNVARKSRYQVQTDFWKAVMSDDTIAMQMPLGGEGYKRLRSEHIDKLNAAWSTLLSNLDQWEHAHENRTTIQLDNFDELAYLHVMMRSAISDQQLFRGQPLKQSLFDGSHLPIGRARQSVQPGDIICVIKGCVAPMNVRLPAPLSMHSTSRPEYEFVSLAYVNGVMDGEAIDDKTAWQDICLV